MRLTTLRFVLAYLRLNLSAAVEYRAAFLVQALGMMLNDLVFIIFWGMYFARFPNVGGWGIQDVALLWAVAATSIGLSAALFGNCTRSYHRGLGEGIPKLVVAKTGIVK